MSTTKKPQGLTRDPRDLKPNPENARGKINEKDPEFLQLVASVKELGVLVPIILSETPANSIIAGHRRQRAAIVAKLKSVPVIIWSGDAAGAAEVALVENACRKDLSPLQQSEAVSALLDKGRTAAKVAELLNVGVGTIVRWARLRTLTQAWRTEIGKANAKHGFNELSAASLMTVASMEPAAQDELLAEMKSGYQVSDERLQRAAADRMREILKAPFDVTAEGLNGKAPICSACPKRASCSPGLFEDVGKGGAGVIPKGDRCLDSVCWDAKRKSAFAAAIKKLHELTGALPVLIIDGHAGESESLVRAAGKLISRIERNWNTTGRTKPMNAEGVAKIEKMPTGCEPALIAETCEMVWLKKTTDRDAGGSKGKKEPGAKKSMKEREAALEKRRVNHVAAALAEVIAKKFNKKAPPLVSKNPMIAARMLVIYGGFMPKNSNSELGLDVTPVSRTDPKVADALWTGARPVMLQWWKYGNANIAELTIIARLVECEYATLRRDAELAIPVPKSWSAPKPVTQARSAG